MSTNPYTLTIPPIETTGVVASLQDEREWHDLIRDLIAAEVSPWEVRAEFQDMLRGEEEDEQWP